MQTTPSQSKGSELLYVGLMLFAAFLFIIVLSNHRARFTTDLDERFASALMSH